MHVFSQAKPKAKEKEEKAKALQQVLQRAFIGYFSSGAGSRGVFHVPLKCQHLGASARMVFGWVPDCNLFSEATFGLPSVSHWGLGAKPPAVPDSGGPRTHRAEQERTPLRCIFGLSVSHVLTFMSFT